MQKKPEGGGGGGGQRRKYSNINQIIQLKKEQKCVPTFPL